MHANSLLGFPLATTLRDSHATTIKACTQIGKHLPSFQVSPPQPITLLHLACRADVAVTDSKGRLRLDSVGGATRARFHALPGVGQKAAKRWWDLGCR